MGLFPSPLLFIPRTAHSHSEHTKPSVKHHKRQELPLEMSSAYVAPHPEVHIGKDQADKPNLTAIAAYNNESPSTAAYRNQQFMDLADDIEGPPPYQAGAADSFIVARDLDYLSSSDTTNMLLYCGGSLHVKTNQYLGGRDFILFPHEVLWVDDARDIIPSDTSSSRISCSSDISIGTSAESSAASTVSASDEQQRPALDQLSQSDAGKCTGMKDMRRLVKWLHDVLPLSEVAPEMSKPCSKSTISASPGAKKGQELHHYGSPCRS